MEKFRECKICNNVYNYQCGEFSNHIKNEHGLSREQYIVITEYNNEHPKCQCGYCNDDATFLPRTNLFLKINSAHKEFNWLENKFIEKYGEPKCKTCGIIVKFHRGKPNIYCSPSCKPSSWNQDTVKKTVIEKYGVKNVMEIKSVKEKVANIVKDYWKNNKNKGVEKIKQTKKDRYGDENYCNINKIKQTLIKKYGVDSYFKTDKARNKSSETVIKTNENNKFLLIKQYKNTDLYYQGTYEYKFLEHCEKNDILNLIKRSKSFHYLLEDTNMGFRHLPDFVFKDKYVIEIKSTYILNKQGGWSVIDAKKRSVENRGYEYVLVLDNNFSIFDKII